LQNYHTLNRLVSVCLFITDLGNAANMLLDSDIRLDALWVCGLFHQLCCLRPCSLSGLLVHTGLSQHIQHMEKMNKESLEKKKISTQVILEALDYLS